MTSPATLDEVYRLLNKRFDELDAQLKVLSALQTQVNSTSQRVDMLEQEILALRNEVETLKQAQLSEQAELRRVTTAALEAEVILSGAPCPTIESASAVVKKVASAVGCPLEEDAVVSARFLVPRGRQPSANRPLPLVVKLSSGGLRARLLSAKKRKGPLTTADLGLTTTGPPSTVYVNEALPADLYKLLIAARAAAREKGFKYVWHQNGSILVRRADGTQVRRIRSAEDLAALPAA